MSKFLGEGGLRPCKEGVLQSWSFDGWNEFTLGTSSWSVFSQLFFLLFKIAISKLQILNMPIRTLFFFFYCDVWYSKGIVFIQFCTHYCIFFRIQFFNVFSMFSRRLNNLFMLLLTGHTTCWSISYWQILQ